MDLKNTYSESSSDTETESSGEEDDDEDVTGEEMGEDSKPKLNKAVPKVVNLKVSSSKNGEQKAKTKNVLKVSKKVVKKKAPVRSSMLTGRGVTTQMLIDENILEAGEKCLTINYLGRQFVGDLKEDGTINCNTANHIFSSPSAWAMHCKKEVNPGKKSGCGWASVKYKGRKLDEFKSTWFRKQKIAQAVAASSEGDSVNSNQYNYLPTFNSNDYIKEEAGVSKNSPLKSLTKGRVKNPPVKSPSPESDLKASKFSSGYVPPTQNYLTFSEALKAVQSGQPVTTMSRMTSTPRMIQNPMKGMSSPVYHTPQQKTFRKRASRTRVSVKHSMLQPNSESTTLVECAQFQSTGKIQPFSIAISTSTLLLIDFHCHLTMSEVSGYLAGKWDPTRQHLRATQAYPCCYMNVTDGQDVERVEGKIRNDMEAKGLTLLGWYHSHPFCNPDPSMNDIKSQLSYQKILKDGHYEPCVGLIVSPYDSHKKESQFNAFWVREPSENNQNLIGLPLSVTFTTHQDQVLRQEMLNEMVSLVNFYRDTSDVVKFTDVWSAESSYLDKLKHSIIRKFPQNQTDGRFLDFIHKMLMAACS